MHRQHVINFTLFELPCQAKYYKSQLTIIKSMLLTGMTGNPPKKVIIPGDTKKLNPKFDDSY